jgi:hypothetical protein
MIMWRAQTGAALVSVFLGGATIGISLPSHRQEGLFSSNDLIEFVLEANWDQLDDDRDQDSEERPGRVLWTDPGGLEVAIPIEVKTRGIFRLKKSTCSFPPFRLDFPSEGTEGTIFNGQDKVKLVTHCRDRDDYEQNVLEEYLVYRIYNLLTDISFRVRPARITYVDSRGEDDPVTRMAFLIEDEDAMADRLGGMIMGVPGAPPSDFQQDQAALMYVFQFMTGNTDWAMSPFHNMKALGVGGDYFPVPYDFDWCGLVDASYAGPNPKIADLIDNVRERLYWGACNDAIDYQAVFALFDEKRDAILALPQSVPELSERNQRAAVGYLKDFYEIIDSERASRRQIVNACRR